LKDKVSIPVQSGNPQDLPSPDLPLLKLTQCPVGLLKGEFLDMGFDRDLSRQMEEFADISAGHVGDALDLLFKPQVGGESMLMRMSLSASSFLMALMTSRPPHSRFFRASTIGFHAGVVSIILCSLSGAWSSVPPAQRAPSSRAKPCSRSLLAKTNIGEFG